MKKLTSTLSLLAVAAGLTATIAMAPAPKKVTVKSSDTNLYWFSIGDGSFIDEDSQTNKQAECGTPLNVNCVRDYDGYDPETETPIGTPIVLQGNKQL